MATRKVYVEVKTRLIIDIEEGVEIDEVMNEIDYSYDSMTDEADIVDAEMIDYEVTDSK